MVEELDGVTHARRIFVRKGGDKVRTNTFVLTFDSTSPRKRTAVCCRCGKGGHAGKDCKADPSCLNCHGPHAADSKECPKWKEEEAILRYKAQHGGTFAQARAAIVVELDPNIKRRTYAKATSVGTKIAQTAPPKGSGRVNSTVKAQGAKSHKVDSPVKKPTVTAESRSTVKPRASPAPQRAPLATFTALTDIEGMEVADAPPISPSSKTAPSQRSLPPSPSPSSSLATIFGDILPDSPVKPSLPPSNPPSPKPKKTSAPYPFTPEVTVERRGTGKKPAGLAGHPTGGLPGSKK
ncbi:hypothetical protein EGW08_023563 [Elysia chlorotica]|uniref:CCHC-type domain-containing protein n=1 Tax=Elysia chlorotica TaxID=188477 RepID=A0A3S1B085_ELYCH|nr:hypothetical protein EGW08_023563 [Elysia chlorotica]